MIKLGRRGIAFKISLVTGGLLIVCTVFMFTVFYFMLPNFYHQYKINSLNAALDRLIDDSAELTLQEAKPELNDFTQKHNVWVGIQDEYNRYVYFPSVFNQESESEYGDTTAVPMRRIDITAPIDNTYPVNRPIVFQDGSYNLNVIASLQPINEASQAILLFAPYMIVLVLIISALGAIAYSRFITRPLISLNQVARKMASLEFDAAGDIRSEDELGELSRNLNRLSRNLQETMSQLKDTNAQLSVEIRKERELEEKRREFIATISHELKTPITAVMGQIEGMIHKIGVYKDRDKYLHRSYTVMQEMEKLVHELLELSKLEAAESSRRRENVDLSEVVKFCLHQLEYARVEKKIDTVIDIEEGVQIRADAKLLSKALMNVIQNAIQYVEPGGKVQVRLEQIEHYIRLYVLNSGEPIPEEQLQRIFDPFHRVEKSRNRHTGGSGLGLYIVKKVLEAHAATYSVSNTNQGVSFVISFPREDCR
ncbi:sensor histidine kinase [Cohnella phaseoli]|uniref:histidine kinase n=1 Tax=Cohnella phaseoli TaxID=456490 RepID=A0A3D9JNQ6_9BACL|nr:HAMP domain-containing sensor histidine kinase [Cohnella phaseoli]RED75086.1 two-component system sensor histidine kinase VanS [Cohnella phaseoli]